MNDELRFKANSGQMEVDEAKGIVECFVAAIGNKDSVGDIIVPGAFDSSFKRRKPRVVWGHDWNSPIGKVLEIYEVPPGDRRMPQKMRDANVGGVYAKVQFNLKSERGREAFANVQFFGQEQEWSIGYKTLEAEWNGEYQANVLKELELYEVSPVLHGANQLTSTISIKQAKLKDPEGGLTAAGRRHYARTEGANLKPGVKGPADTPQKMRRKGSFLTRFFTNPSGPMKKPNGEPTRLALSAAAWGEPIPKNRSDAAKLAAKGRRLLERYENSKKKSADSSDGYDLVMDRLESFFNEEFTEMGFDEEMDFKRAPSAADLDVISDAVGLDPLPQERVTGDVLRGYGPRRGNLERLLRYWRPIMRKPGGFRRCRVILADHPELYPLENLCAWLHHETTGLWPNEGCHHPGMKNCRKKAKKLAGVVNGSLISNEEFESRMRKLRKGKKDAGMNIFDMGDWDMDDDPDEMEEHELIEKFVEALKEFVAEEPAFLEMLSEDNWYHEGQSEEDGEWYEHLPMWSLRDHGQKPKMCGCGGCSHGKADLTPRQKKSAPRRPARRLEHFNIKSADPFSLESDLSPVLDNYGINRSVSIDGIKIDLSGVNREGIAAVKNALRGLGQKNIGRGLGGIGGGGRGRGPRPGNFNPDAFDADGDGIVQDGTVFERPAVLNKPKKPKSTEWRTWSSVEELKEMVANIEEREDLPKLRQEMTDDEILAIIRREDEILNEWVPADEIDGPRPASRSAEGDGLGVGTMGYEPGYWDDPNAWKRGKVRKPKPPKDEPPKDETPPTAPDTQPIRKPPSVQKLEDVIGRMAARDSANGGRSSGDFEEGYGAPVRMNDGYGYSIGVYEDMSRMSVMLTHDSEGNAFAQPIAKTVDIDVVDNELYPDGLDFLDISTLNGENDDFGQELDDIFESPDSMSVISAYEDMAENDFKPKTRKTAPPTELGEYQKRVSDFAKDGARPDGEPTPGEIGEPNFVMTRHGFGVVTNAYDRGYDVAILTDRDGNMLDRPQYASYEFGSDEEYFDEVMMATSDSDIDHAGMLEEMMDAGNDPYDIFKYAREQQQNTQKKASDAAKRARDIAKQLQNGEIPPSEAADRLGDLYSLFQGMGVGVAGWRSQVWQLLQEAEGLVGKSLASAPMSIHRSWITPVVSHYGIPYKVQNGKVYYDTSKVTKSAKDALHQSLRSAKSAISDQVQVKREYSPKKREEYAKRGLAMPDGSYPIRDVGDLKNAIQAFGRAKDPEAVKRHIIRRARSLGQVDLVPEKWML